MASVVTPTAATGLRERLDALLSDVDLEPHWRARAVLSEDSRRSRSSPGRQVSPTAAILKGLQPNLEHAIVGGGLDRLDIHARRDRGQRRLALADRGLSCCQSSQMSATCGRAAFTSSTGISTSEWLWSPPAQTMPEYLGTRLSSSASRGSPGPTGGSAPMSKRGKARSISSSEASRSCGSSPTGADAPCLKDGPLTSALPATEYLPDRELRR